MQILIAEDEENIAKSLKKNFAAEGHQATLAFDGEKAIKLTNELEFDAILLDWRMPKMSGIEVCKKLRADGNKTPIILLTALSDLSNKLEALNLGADDYITKPFSFKEVLARTLAVVRRYRSVENLLYIEDFTLDLINRKLNSNKGELKLSDKEFELLKFFIKNKGSILSKEQLCSEVWQLDFSPGTNIVEATIKNLRKHLEYFTDKKFIKTLYGEGYIFISD